MSDFDFIIGNIRFSHSSTSTFETCAYGFKLHYIEGLPSKSNFYSEFGTLIHECMEKFFTKELTEWELPSYYRENFNKVITSPLPMGQEYLRERYMNQGEDFLNSFYFPIDDFNIVIVEDTIEFDIDDISVTARPDLVLQNKVTGDYILYDYKTSLPFKTSKITGVESVDNLKIDGYKRQMGIYTYAVRNIRKFPIKSVVLWFPRAFREISYEWVQENEDKTIKWLKDTVAKIRIEKDFYPNNKNYYFCNNLCNVREYCEYRP